MIKRMVSLLACAALLLAFTAFAIVDYNNIDMRMVFGYLTTYCAADYGMNSDEFGIYVDTRDGSKANKNAIINYLKQSGFKESEIHVSVVSKPFWENEDYLWEWYITFTSVQSLIKEGTCKVYTSFPGEYNSPKNDVAEIFENCRLWSFEERYYESGRVSFMVTTDDVTTANMDAIQAIVESWGYKLGSGSNMDNLDFHYDIRQCKDLIGLAKYGVRYFDIQTIQEANVNGNPRGVTVGTSNMSQQNQAEIVKDLRKRGYDKNAIEIHYVPEGTANIALTDSAAAPPQNSGTDTLPPTGDASLPAAPFILLGLSAAAGIAAMAKRRRLAK